MLSSSTVKSLRPASDDDFLTAPTHQAPRQNILETENFGKVYRATPCREEQVATIACSPTISDASDDVGFDSAQNCQHHGSPPTGQPANKSAHHGGHGHVPQEKEEAQGPLDVYDRDFLQDFDCDEEYEDMDGILEPNLDHLETPNLASDCPRDKSAVTNPSFPVNGLLSHESDKVDEAALWEAMTIYEDSLPQASPPPELSSKSAAPTSVIILNEISPNVARSSSNAATKPASLSYTYSGRPQSTLTFSPAKSSGRSTQTVATGQPEKDNSYVPKLQWLPPRVYNPREPSKKFKPSRQSKPAPAPAPALKRIATSACRKVSPLQPFARLSFPKPVQEGSAISGLVRHTALRTCFRIGEALNSAAAALRSEAEIILELYARVSSSTRDLEGGYKQQFDFMDLFTDKAPYLHGTFYSWKGVKQWDRDAQAFLGARGKGRLCRVIGKIRKSDDIAAGCEMVIMSIWDVDWDDIQIAKGIVLS